MPPIARFSLVALDCPDAFGLAQFYSGILGGKVHGSPGDDWVELVNEGPTVAFQQVPDHRPPEWPSSEKPQQAHIDFDVMDLDVGEAEVKALGAHKADFQPGTTFRVFLDPAGHPFCLVLDESMR
jgi:catechol 2,3-dioxygenase-like lactoylglutathione lyase family enzyme